MAFMAFTFMGCEDTKCHIHGVIPEKYNGKKIFLVPLTNDTRYNVDSVVIKNGKFDFTSDTLMMAKILVDYHYRLGVEPLLVVVEPGEINVVIDSISSANGTPQNDSLDQWKTRKQQHDFQYTLMSSEIKRLKDSGDSLQGKQLKSQADSFHLAFKNYTRRMAENLKEGSLHDFLGQLYPRTYKRWMPDSTLMEFDADTNEPIAQ